MKTVVLEDGSTIEVPTEEEIKALQDKAGQVDTLNKTVEDLQKAKAEYEKDPVEKNWKQMRENNDKMKKALQDQGKIVNDDGTIVEKSIIPTLQEIEQTATNAAKRVSLETAKAQALSQFGEEDRKLVEHYLNKLTTGEQVDSTNIYKFIQDAAILAKPTQPVRKVFSPNGQPPQLLDPDKVQAFGETPAGQSLANEIFGKDSFAAPKK